MRVILLQDVAKTGHKLEIVEVPNGYALNQLIPKGMAKPATPENLKALKQDMEKAEADKASSQDAFLKVKEAIADQAIKVKVEANEEGHLFAALKAEQIVAEMIKLAPETTANMVVIDEPIKSLGEHTVNLVWGDEKVPVKILLEA